MSTFHAWAHVAGFFVDRLFWPCLLVWATLCFAEARGRRQWAWLAGVIGIAILISLAWGGDKIALELYQHARGCPA
jgi:uncharacterized membrane protein YdcZ (DUF606 family)